MKCRILKGVRFDVFDVTDRKSLKRTPQCAIGGLERDTIMQSTIVTPHFLRFDLADMPAAHVKMVPNLLQLTTVVGEMAFELAAPLKINTGSLEHWWRNVTLEVVLEKADRREPELPLGNHPYKLVQVHVPPNGRVVIRRLSDPIAEGARDF